MNYSSNNSETLSTSGLYEYYMQWHPANYITIVSSGVFGFVGAFSNFSLIAIIFSRRIRKIKPHEVILLSMALAEFCTCVNISILESYFIQHSEQWGCKVAGFVTYSFRVFCFYLPGFTMYNRFLSLYNPTLFKKIFTIPKVILMCISSLLLHLALVSVILLHNAIGLDDMGICGVQLINQVAKISNLIMLIYIAIWYTVGVWCGRRVIKKLQEHKSGVATVIKSKVIEESQQLTRLMMIFLVVPACTQLPSVIAKSIQYVTQLSPWISRGFNGLVPIAFAFDPIITIITIKDYKHVARRKLGWIIPVESSAVQNATEAISKTAQTKKKVVGAIVELNF